MYVGCQGIGTSRHELQFLVRHGVTHMDTSIDPDDFDLLRKSREEAAAEGVERELDWYFKRRDQRYLMGLFKATRMI